MGRWRAAAVSMVMVVSVLAAPGAHADATSPPGAFTSAPASDEITLITGDQVEVRAVDGGHHAVTVTPAPRADGSVPTFQVLESDDGLTVIPDDVATLVPQRLDSALFNVTALAEQGYGSAIPLILTYTGNTTKAAIPAVKQVRTLESIGGAAVQVATDDAAAFGAELTRLATPALRAAGPLAGVEKIWLDRKVEPDLEQSVPQIGAPEAWAAGYDGTGTTVAVLDTGVDATHPDLAGKVASQRDFTGESAAGDPHGHGTHVASTIAGIGAGGVAKGVAPGATLLSGRVLGADGYGQLSWIIDGMEWAAGEQHAAIVNMSLGSPEQGGPLTAAVTELTRQYGTLFVVAAGNGGCDECVGSPGDAPEALTVGAVDKQDKLADFSSKGPITADLAVKPDVTAPGVDITAARTGGGELTLSGTSMATPHVAGAAALLRQARPGVTGNELKSLLMAAAEPGEGIAVDAQGAGRIDVAAALKGTVAASTGSAGFGKLTVGERKSLTVGYHNLGQAPAELALSAGDGFTVEPAQLTVPAGGTAEVRVTASADRPGLLRQELTATLAGGGGTVRTLLTGSVDVKRVELRVRGIARDGRPGRGGFTVLNLDEGTLVGRVLPGDPSQPCTDQKYGSGTCLLVKPGTYSVLGHIFTMPATQDSTATGKPLNESLLGDPEMTITENTEVVLDARKAVEVEVKTPDHRTKRNTGAAAALMWYRSAGKGTALRGGTTITPGGQVEERLFVQPTRKVTKGTFTVATRWRLTAPQITFSTLGLRLDPYYVDPVQFSDFATEYPRLDGTRLLMAVDAGRGSAEEIKARDLRGKLAVIRRTDGVPVSTQSNAAAAAGAAMVAVYSDKPGADVTTGGNRVKLSVPTVRLTHEEGTKLVERLRRLPVPIVAKGVVASPYLYDLYLREQGRVRDSLTYVVRSRSLARIETGYHSQLADDVTVNEARFVFEPWDTSSISTNHPMAKTPRTRTDYVTPDPELRWSTSAGSPERSYNNMWPHPDTVLMGLSSPEFRPYEKGERVSRTVFKQPLLPGINPRNPLRREGDLLRLSMQGFVDADRNYGAAYTSDFEHGLKTDFRLYQGDTLLWQTNYLPSGSGTLPPEKGTYRIEYDVTNEAGWAKLSTRTKAAWTFTSERADGTTVVPLLLATFDAPVDLKNQARSSRKLGLSLYQQEGAEQSAIKDVSLEVSYDDGATWTKARLRDRGERSYEATIGRSPSGFVSLRLNASDVNGNTLSQEVIRAYAVH
ncbi:S8 family serine peptidase [Nonomuraea phyllanthi]|uniref:S8 family serine peptidase n=1 Tax=Nonomuraea phyllanthi TaxID=2219224 RepID=A0A5C4WCZ3_9ACTN|nr:S8 family serine peptidase [Nonomuraea phyllanthi]KAB8193274.1 S8 family serine peptidase [Nonomuraea phyllanthi]